MNKPCVYCKKNPQAVGASCQECWDKAHVHIINSMLIDARNFDWRATQIVGIDIVVLVNSTNARSFERWLGKSGIIRLSRAALHTARITELYNDWAVHRGEVRLPSISQQTVKHYLKRTLVRDSEHSDTLQQNCVVRGWFARTWWKNPIGVDFNND